MAHKPWPVFGLEGRSTQDVRDAVDLGYRRFDAGEGYGRTTDELAEAVRDSGADREEMEVLYRFDVRADESRADLKARLQEVAAKFDGHLDAAVIGNLDAPEEQVKEAWKVLGELKEEGTVRQAGVAGVAPRHANLLVDLRQEGRVDVVDFAPEPAGRGQGAGAGWRKNLLDALGGGEDLRYYQVVKALGELMGRAAQTEQGPQTRQAPQAQQAPEEARTAHAPQMSSASPIPSAAQAAPTPPAARAAPIPPAARAAPIPPAARAAPTPPAARAAPIPPAARAAPTSQAASPTSRGPQVSQGPGPQGPSGSDRPFPPQPYGPSTRARDIVLRNDETPLPDGVRNLLVPLYEDPERLRQEVRAFAADGAVDRETVSRWLIEERGFAREELEGVTVPDRVGLRGEYRDMRLADVLAGHLGPNPRDHAVAHELGYALLHDADTWKEVRPALNTVAYPPAPPSVAEAAALRGVNTESLGQGPTRSREDATVRLPSLTVSVTSTHSR
ncbi:aldo/keto reductase [Streptomyces sp. NPDC094038]|uniref:aldo/keto reductase n=1 Tax=Streptomyces sp. NPDC094038 TaxID=3366055 RepID=UPI0037F1F03C